MAGFHDGLVYRPDAYRLRKAIVVRNGCFIRHNRAGPVAKVIREVLHPQARALGPEWRHLAPTCQRPMRTHMAAVSERNTARATTPSRQCRNQRCMYESHGAGRTGAARQPDRLNGRNHGRRPSEGCSEPTPITPS